MSLARRPWQCLAETMTHGDQTEAAECLGISPQTLKNHLDRLRVLVDAPNTMALAHRVGWAVIPDWALSGTKHHPAVGRPVPRPAQHDPAGRDAPDRDVPSEPDFPDHGGDPDSNAGRVSGTRR